MTDRLNAFVLRINKCAFSCVFLSRWVYAYTQCSICGNGSVLCWNKKTFPIQTELFFIEIELKVWCQVQSSPAGSGAGRILFIVARV